MLLEDTIKRGCRQQSPTATSFGYRELGPFLVEAHLEELVQVGCHFQSHSLLMRREKVLKRDLTRRKGMDQDRERVGSAMVGNAKMKAGEACG